MRSFKKLFHKSNDDQMASPKHSKPTPLELPSHESMYEPYADPFKAVYGGETPLKISDISYVEQAPGMLDIHRAQWDHPRSRAHFDRSADLDNFPSPPQQPAKPSRSGLRTTSLNSSMRPQLPMQNWDTTERHIAGRNCILQRSPSAACFSRPTATAYPSLVRKQRRGATVDEALANVVKTPDGRAPVFGSSRQAERVRAKSSAGCSYTPALPAPPVPTTSSSRPPISRSAHSSRANLHRVPSHVAIPRTVAPDYRTSYK
ncbi:hypothetical protein DEU56DRAFT_904355 [Suillus clintonianus]|uniref:uncharacterized protein n=1 Tax=Suillus clintonianus TaxID=1904413 RepID=UPI001B87BC33|nr:uncharacterized protein DEU56DRAFT_904355 [Suillus clintonianus]KAG2122726.1 hypothetical protein DEU56DRAFT_904355 [Suillus clintonianus]